MEVSVFFFAESVSVFDQIIAVLTYVCYTLMIGQLFQFSVRMLHYDTLSASLCKNEKCIRCPGEVFVG